MKKLTIVVCILAFIIAIALLKITRAEDPPDMSVRIFDVTQDTIKDSPIYIVASVTSTYELSKVVATVIGTETENKSVELNYNYVEGTSKTNWSSYINLPNWSRGTKTITVTATNIFKSTATSEPVSFTYNAGPVMTANIPATNSVIQNDLDVSVVCEECVLIRLLFYYLRGASLPLISLQTTERTLTTKIEVGEYTGTAMNLAIKGENAAGELTEMNSILYIETSKLLKPYSGTLPEPVDSQGWRAYTYSETPSELYNVYIKPPTEDAVRVTFFSTNSFITDTAQAAGESSTSANRLHSPTPPTGECMFIHEARRYLVSLTTEPKEICSSLGQAFRGADSWFVQIADTVFVVDLATDPIDPPTPPDPTPRTTESSGGGGCFIGVLGGFWR